MALFLGTLLFYLPTVGSENVNNDNFAASVSAWRIATSGTPWMDGLDTSQLPGAEHPDEWIVRAENGHEVHNRTAGVVLVAVPFYLALNNDPDPADFELWVGGVSAAFLTAGAGLLFFLAMRPLVGPGTALGSVLVFEFATPAWSVGANAIWTHSTTMFALAGATWAVATRRWVLAGAFLGVGVLARPHIAVVAAVVGLGLAMSRRRWKVALSIGLPSAGFLGLLVAWNGLVFGSWGVQGGYGDYVVRNVAGGASGGSWRMLLNVLGFLLSPDRGLVVWTPVVLVLLPTLIARWRSLPDWSRWLILGGLAYSVLQLRLNSFTGGQGYYGYRHGLELLACLFPAMTLVVGSVNRVQRLLLGPLVGLQVVAVGLGAVVNGLYVPESQVWVDNSLLVAFRQQPAMTGMLLFAGACLGAAAAVAWARRGPDGQTVEDAVPKQASSA